jgi:uncharacterized repeat protein (TIGR01451 family)
MKLSTLIRSLALGMALALIIVWAVLALPAQADDGPQAITETPTPTTTDAGITETATATAVTATATVVTATSTPVTATATTPAEGGTPSPTPTGVVATNTPPPQPTSENNPTPAPPGVSITKRASSDRVAIGDVVEYTMVVINPNSSAVENVSVRDTLPTQVDYVSASSPVGSVSYDAGTRSVIFTIGTLTGNQQVTISIRARVNAAAPVPSSLLNQAVLTSGSGTSSQTTTQSNLTVVEVVPGQLPNTGEGPGPREIVTMAVAAAVACLGGFALIRRVRDARAVVRIDEQPRE